MALSEFDLKYGLAKAVKGQVMADFVIQHCGPELAIVDLVPWTLFFDGSSCGVGSGIGVVLISPWGATFEFSKLLLPTIKLNIRRFSKEFNCLARSKPMQWKYLGILCW